MLFLVHQHGGGRTPGRSLELLRSATTCRPVPGQPRVRVSGIGTSSGRSWIAQRSRATELLGCLEFGEGGHLSGTGVSGFTAAAACQLAEKGCTDAAISASAADYVGPVAAARSTPPSQTVRHRPRCAAPKTGFRRTVATKYGLGGGPTDYPASRVGCAYRREARGSKLTKQCRGDAQRAWRWSRHRCRAARQSR
jgi:hypothetical protein